MGKREHRGLRQTTAQPTLWLRRRDACPAGRQVAQRIEENERSEDSLIDVTGFTPVMASNGSG